MSVRVGVVARSPVMRAGIEHLLARADDLVVVGVGATREALDGEGVRDLDVLVWDDAGERPWRSSADARAAAAPRLVILVDEPSPALAREAVARGVHGVLPRDAAEPALLAAVRAAAAGLLVLPPEAARAELPSRATIDDATHAPALTPRELEVLHALAEGLANKQVAARLRISEHTIKTHVAALYEKLSVTTRAEAVARGVQLGLLML